MDPMRPESFTHKCSLLSTGRRYHYVDEVPHEYDPQQDSTILCIHGFPDFWAGWKYQIGPWVRAGYRVVAPDMLGYGQSDKPHEPEEYSLKRISSDLASILDVILVGKAIVIGHDWGSHIAARFALWYPERVLGVVQQVVGSYNGFEVVLIPPSSVSLGYFPPSSNYEDLDVFVKRFPIYKYQLYFASTGSSAELERNVRTIPTLEMADGDRLTPANSLDRELLQIFIFMQELQYIMSQNDTMRGPTNYYRTWNIRFNEEKDGHLPETYRQGTPVLFLRGAKDGTSSKAVLRETRRLYPAAKIITYEDAAHWLMLEKKEAVARDVLDWLCQVGL
ncbi:alpha/beta-hydrolase [Thelephora ganbajun]|uniref:Alpha/beta-hydrolase n=1 Tax=Thelephora ganbajun TaxID=370292 RepID=A0ACB6Z6I4_THEGA|nr:alpha/beta-hydrolase [Thelephora ganbajun]